MSEGRKRYRVIYTDNPWPHRCWSGAKDKKRTADSHYETMTLEELRSLAPLLQSIADPAGCYLYMWCTAANMPEALELGKQWGWEYKTIVHVWVKLTKRWPKRFYESVRDWLASSNLDSTHVYTPRSILSSLVQWVEQSSFEELLGKCAFFGMGNYSRANAEFLLLFTRGKCTAYRNKSIRQLIFSRITKHSEKPHEARRRIEAEHGDALKVELFSRHTVEGWDTHGLEVGKLGHVPAQKEEGVE